MVNKLYITGTLMLASLISIPSAVAQGYSPAALEVLKEQRLWFNTTNAAGAFLDDTRNYSELALKWKEQDGDFRRPQQGAQESHAGVDCEGFMNLGNALVWGEFSFMQNNVNRAGFNSSIADPYRGMPFFYADAKESPWRGQSYNMRFRASTPLVWGKWAFGVEGGYHSTIAAKQLDPRVDTRYFELNVNPGVVYQINDKHSIGADFQYSAIKEDSRVNNINSSISQTLYLLSGLGVSSVYIFDYNGNDTDYHGHLLGCGLQYNFRSDGLNILLHGDYSRHVENFENLQYSETSTTVPENKCSVKDDRYDFGVTFNGRSEKWTNYLTLGGNLRYIKGIQDINLYENDETDPGWVLVSRNIRSTFDSAKGSVSYSLLRNRGSEYAWRIDAGVTYNYEWDEYILPHAVKNYETLASNLGGKYNFRIGKNYNRRLLVGVKGGFIHGFSEKYEYSEDITANPTIDMEQADLDYFSANAWNLGGSVTYSQQIKSGYGMNMYARADFNYVKVTKGDFNHRRHVDVAIGFTF